MKRALVIAGIFAFVASPVFAQTSSPGTPAATPAPAQATPPATGAAAAPSTADFVKTAAISDMFEIQSSELALKKHAKADRTFAERMIRDHGKTTAQLKQLVHSGRVKAKLPTALDPQHRQMLDKLRGESGQAFDKDYDSMQVQGHEAAVALFQNYAQDGDNAALKQWAGKTLPTLQQHLSMAQKLS